MRRRNTFDRLTGSTYICDTCGRRTRNTGVQGIGSHLCPQCFELAGIENEISDSDDRLRSIAERRDEVLRLRDEIRAKGGNPEKYFDRLFTLVDPPTRFNDLFKETPPMATKKTARTTRRTAPPAPRTLTLPRLDDTKNFAVFGVEVERGTVAPFGKVYIPLAEADGIASVTVTVDRNGR